MLAFLFLGFSAFILAAVLVHEAGHIVAGLLCGFRITAVKVGPVELQLPHSWRWTLRHTTFLNGFVRVQFCKVPGPDGRWRCVGFLLGGSLANVGAAIVTVPFSHGYTDWANVIRYFILISGVVASVQLVPFEALGTRSDGSKLWSLFFSKTERDKLIFLLSLRARGDEVKALYRDRRPQEALDKVEKWISTYENIPSMAADPEGMRRLLNLRDSLQQCRADAADPAPAILRIQTSVLSP